MSVHQPGPHLSDATWPYVVCCPNCKQLWLCCLFADAHAFVAHAFVAHAFAAADGAASIDNCSTGLLCSPWMWFAPFAHAALTAHRLRGVNDAAVSLSVTALSDLQ